MLRTQIHKQPQPEIVVTPWSRNYKVTPMATTVFIAKCHTRAGL